jgi:hypothetical protein
MEELIDLIVTDASPAEISDSIKSVLYSKAAERIDNAKPIVASSIFNEFESTEEESSED